MGGRIADWAADRGYGAGWRFVRAMPPRIASGAFRVGADITTRRGGRGVRQLRANLARVVPDATAHELDDLVRAGLRSYARYWCEVFRLPSLDPTEIHRRMDPLVTGMEPAWEALDAGRGVVFALPHSGNWDMAGVWFLESLRLRGREPVFTTVVERLRPQQLYRRFVDYRESLGFEVVVAEDGAATYRTLMKRLSAGGAVCLVADRDLSGFGATVSFFGESASFPRGPARLAALTGALLLPAFPQFTPDGWALPLGEPITVPDRATVDKATQAIADAFTGLITRAPADWHMLQPVFTADRVSVVS
ncbi:phosphatidylinositol mannoside acyltransferase [Pseudonocardia hispaniensis]|uniref:Phosphatidylinositol mannoside acyltransferase n=1 Tax=Pseudonocardia hispaniensis TaxID=904933 RepID=A0ABW1J124_9PSEU